MPDKETLDRAQEDEREGKSPSTQAGEFVRQEFEHIREGKHGAAAAKQAIAIGLSEARRAGIKLPPPKAGTTSAQVRKKAERDSEIGQSGTKKKKTSAKRSRAVENALKKKGHAAASHAALSKQAKQAAAKRSPSARSQAAKKAARTRARSGHNRYGK